MEIEKGIEILKSIVLCGLCTTAQSRGLESCKDCHLFKAKKFALQAMREKSERNKMTCVNCQDYNKQRCPISRCYNNNPKNGYRTPFEKTDFCSYFNPNDEVCAGNEDYGKTWLPYYPNKQKEEQPL